MSDTIRIVWHDPQKSNLEFFVFASESQYQKWKQDKSIPLVNVLSTFDIFEVPNGGNTGIASRPSRITLSSVFDKTDDTAIIQEILEHGKMHHSTRAGSKTSKDRSGPRGFGDMGVNLST